MLERERERELRQRLIMCECSVASLSFFISLGVCFIRLLVDLFCDCVFGSGFWGFYFLIAICFLIIFLQLVYSLDYSVKLIVFSGHGFSMFWLHKCCRSIFSRKISPVVIFLVFCDSMPKYRRNKFMEESSGASGEYPEHGAIFMSNSSTRKECLRRQLFGLPIGQAGFVKQVKAGMLLFLFEFESRELHGVFQACSDGAINIDPDAFSSSGKQFPAQVKFTEKLRCKPLGESEFRHAISDNYFTPKKFNFGLSRAQVQRLLKLFSTKKVERPRVRKTAAAKPTRKFESRFGNTAGDRGFRNRRAEETVGDVDREFPFGVTSAGDLLGCRLTENYGLGDESDIGVTTEESEYSASGWLENEYYEKDGITHASSWSNHAKHLNLESDSVVPAQSSVPLESAYGTNTECYDPCNPGIMGDATMKSSRHDIDVDFIPVGGLDYYNSVPTEHPEYQTRTGMTGVACSESESRYGHLHHSHLPGFLTSAGATENMMNEVNYEISPYQHQEEFGGHASYSNDKVARDSRIYPSFAYPSNPGDGADLYLESRTQNKVQAYQQHEEFGGEAFDSGNRVIRMKDRVSPDELGRKTARKSVFSRLGMPSKEPDAEKDSSPETEPVDEVMAFLKDCEKHLMEHKGPNITDPARFGNPNKKKGKIHRKEVLDNDLMLPFTETSADDLLDSEERMEQKRPFIDFKRRSEAVKSNGNLTQGCKDSLEDSASPDKKRKLLRPKLIEDDSEKDRVNNDMALKSASEVPVLDPLGRVGQRWKHLRT